MEKGRVSVIMSAYNVEKTIGKAIKSVLGQTYKDIELVVVDDCSTDRTADIVKSFDDSRIKHIRNERNMGAGWARDIGIKVSTGEWIAFVDSDDWLSEDFIESMVNGAVRYNADLVSAGYTRVEGEKETVFLPEAEGVQDKWIVTDPKNIVYKFLNITLSKREIWDNFHYSHLRFQEDVTSLNFLIYHAKKRAFVRNAGYYYWQNPESLCHKASKVKTLIYNALAAVELNSYFEKVDKSMARLEMFKLPFNSLCQVAMDKRQKTELEKYKEELGKLLIYAMQNYDII